jgi:hypothetical protein
MTTATLTITRIDDHEGDGECSSCRRTGLRWVATLSDGTAVGLECAKKILGWKPAPASYNWIADFTPVAEHVDYGDTLVMWQHKTGNQTRETCNGVLVTVGGVRADWTKKGWL